MVPRKYKCNDKIEENHKKDTRAILAKIVNDQKEKRKIEQRELHNMDM